MSKTFNIRMKDSFSAIDSTIKIRVSSPKASNVISYKITRPETPQLYPEGFNSQGYAVVYIDIGSTTEYTASLYAQGYNMNKELIGAGGDTFIIDGLQCKEGESIILNIEITKDNEEEITFRTNPSIQISDKTYNSKNVINPSPGKLEGGKGSTVFTGSLKFTPTDNDFVITLALTN